MTSQKGCGKELEHFVNKNGKLVFVNCGDKLFIRLCPSCQEKQKREVKQ